MRLENLKKLPVGTGVRKRGYILSIGTLSVGARFMGGLGAGESPLEQSFIGEVVMEFFCG